ncbi:MULTISPECIES: hypothetical protein [Pseudomonadati]|uniref:hypothetical protein n=1 Tax=unclassified Halobacteriovorax TaxID=2639665 RepID=UPI001304DD51|nr:hypothetical protein [Halobacteriovorax sp. DA5]
MLPPDAYEAIVKMIFVLMAGCVLCMSKIKAAEIDHNQVFKTQVYSQAITIKK